MKQIQAETKPSNSRNFRRIAFDVLAAGPRTLLDIARYCSSTPLDYYSRKIQELGKKAKQGDEKAIRELIRIVIDNSIGQIVYPLLFDNPDIEVFTKLCEYKFVIFRRDGKLALPKRKEYEKLAKEAADVAFSDSLEMEERFLAEVKLAHRFFSCGWNYSYEEDGSITTKSVEKYRRESSSRLSNFVQISGAFPDDLFSIFERLALDFVSKYNDESPNHIQWRIQHFPREADMFNKLHVLFDYNSISDDPRFQDALEVLANCNCTPVVVRAREILYRRDEGQ